MNLLGAMDWTALTSAGFTHLLAVAGPGEAEHYGLVAGAAGLVVAIIIRWRLRAASAAKSTAE
jgi:hypothetical protein